MVIKKIGDYMDLKINKNLGDNYSSNSQKSKNITEQWVLENFQCPFCNVELKQFEANNKCADYYCPRCNDEFELKSIKGKFSKNKITGSEYFSTIEKINSKKPNWILMERNDVQVTGLTFIPKQFFYPEMIEKRKKLSSKAQRAGWCGCLIHINMVPSFAKIQYIRDGIEVNRKIINYKLDMVNRFKDMDSERKSWELIVLSLIDRIPETIFALDDLYVSINELKIDHPTNNFIEEKIRQTLQKLRNEGYIRFLDSQGYRGLYQKLF